VNPPTYEEFIEAKRVEAQPRGFEPTVPFSKVLFPFQVAAILWALRLGCAALFESFGLGKTRQQLEIGRQVCALTGERFLIVAPLGVRGEFEAEARALGLEIRFVRRTSEVDAPGLYLTNYESVREGKIDPRIFAGASLDEADCLRGMGGTKTFRECMVVFEHMQVRFKFIATATPAPNDYEELLAYAAFLDVMDIGEAKTRFFKRDSTKADRLTLHPHKEGEFFAWLSTWALFVDKPSDLDRSFSDDRYVLPELRMHWHELATDHSDAGEERGGQQRLVKDSAIGVTAAAREKRDSLDRRVARVREIVAALRGPDGKLTDQPVIWCDLNDEQRAIERALDAEGISYASLDGSLDDDERLALIGEWKRGERTAFITKPVMYGAGVNLQQSHTEIFVGIGFKAKDFMQAIHRVHRFGQSYACDIHAIYTDAEREVRRTLERKWEQHRVLVARMIALVREHGLARDAMAAQLARATDVERREARGERFVLVNNDTVRETRAMPDDSIDMIITSIPFSTQYEYTPSYLDFGHTDDNEHFWAQMDFLTPELLRVLRPGRVAAIHVKDRIVPGGLTGLGFQTLQPFHCETITHWKKHGFAFLGMITIVTDVVRENNQTYRLAYTEQCKDGSRQGVGVPEYLLLFRKPQTDRARGYADVPVVKSKADYRLARWQLDAAGFHRSSGNRLLTAEDLAGLEHHQIYKAWRQFNSSTVYDYEHHVALNAALEDRGALPTDFSLMPAHSAHPDVWTDVARMRTLNGAQSAAGREMHLCPLQFDIVDRAIVQHTMPNETVFDPFSGIGTVPYCAVKLGRKGRGHELNPRYHNDSVGYCRAAEREASVPTLFNLDAGAAE
jgi:hypothetical protein